MKLPVDLIAQILTWLPNRKVSHFLHKRYILKEVKKMLRLKNLSTHITLRCRNDVMFKLIRDLRMDNIIYDPNTFDKDHEFYIKDFLHYRHMCEGNNKLYEYFPPKNKRDLELWNMLIEDNGNVP